MINEVKPSFAAESFQALSSLATQITALLSANASLSAAEIQAATAKSQPSISLAIGELGN